MVPTNQGPSPFHDSSLNMTPRDNCYILSYTCSNAILKYFQERVQILISMVQVLDPKYEPVTCGSPYNFVVWNHLVTGHLGKMPIIPIGETNSDSTYVFGTWTCEATSV